MDARLDAQLDRPVERRPADAGDGGRGDDGGPGRLDGGRRVKGADGANGLDGSNGLDGLDGLDGFDDADGLDGLSAALDRVWAEHAGAADTLLDARLRLIVHRGIPARAIRPAPGTRTIRVVFADGTILLCRGTGQGDFGRLGLALQQHRSVRLGSFARGVDGTRLEFRWHPDHRLAATVVGLDQPD